MLFCVWAASAWAPVYAGVPQGSSLGPLLFLIFIDDIVTNINCSIRLFAEDVSLYIVVENPQTADLTVNLDLSTISKWPLDWIIDFNEPSQFHYWYKNRPKWRTHLS